MLFTDSSLTGITGINTNSSGLIVFGLSQGAPSSTATAASKFAVGCVLQDVNTGNIYNNVGTVASPSWDSSNSVRTATATVAGATTGTLTAGNQFVTVTSSDANHIVILPPPVPGTRVTLINGATGYELRTSAPATIGINGGTGASAESAIGATTTVHMTCVTATAWTGFQQLANGTLTLVEVAA